MHKTSKFIISSCLITGLSIIPTLSQSETTNSVTFVCKETHDQSSGQKFPTIMAWIPEKQKHTPIIIWKSEYFPKNWNRQKRCETVTAKFQKFYDEGRLELLTYGRVTINNETYPVVCAVKQVGDRCTADNQLFQVKDYPTSERIIDQLNEI